MTNSFKQSLWRQFGASIEMLGNAISNCPDDHFLTNKRFFYIAYYAVVLLDYYLTIPPKDFLPVLPFSIEEIDERPKDLIGDMIPDKIYSKNELVDYVDICYNKCKNLIAGLADENPEDRFTEGSEPGDMDYPFFEILLYNMRHIQHHIGQLNLLIRQSSNEQMEWIFQAGKDLSTSLSKR